MLLIKFQEYFEKMYSCSGALTSSGLLIPSITPWFKMILSDKNMKSSTKETALRKEPHKGWYWKKILKLLG